MNCLSHTSIQKKENPKNHEKSAAESVARNYHHLQESSFSIQKGITAIERLTGNLNFKMVVLSAQDVPIKVLAGIPVFFKMQCGKKPIPCIIKLKFPNTYVDVSCWASLSEKLPDKPIFIRKVGKTDNRFTIVTSNSGYNFTEDYLYFAVEAL